jgi:hypothetical protein
MLARLGEIFSPSEPAIGNKNFTAQDTKKRGQRILGVYLFTVKAMHGKELLGV